MSAISMLSEQLPIQPHLDHRTIDVTQAGHIHPRRLCLDCHVEYEIYRPPIARKWMIQVQ